MAKFFSQIRQFTNYKPSIYIYGYGSMDILRLISLSFLDRITNLWAILEIALAWIGFFLTACPANAFQRIIHKSLDENIIYGIRVAWRTGTTTILFPGAISGIYGQRVAKQEQENADFLVSFMPGSFHFTLRALHANAEDQLTVIFEKKAYVLHLSAADEGPYLTVSFFYPRRVAAGKSLLTPESLLSLLDRAKAYSLLQKGAPDALVGVERIKSGREIYYQGFRVILREVFRFDPEDAVVFHIEFESESDHLIRYRPDELAVRLGDRIYVQSIADASGVIPSRGREKAFFVIVGTPEGGRNNLRANNPWNILVVRTQEAKAK